MYLNLVFSEKLSPTQSVWDMISRPEKLLHDGHHKSAVTDNLIAQLARSGPERRSSPSARLNCRENGDRDVRSARWFRTARNWKTVQSFGRAALLPGVGGHAGDLPAGGTAALQHRVAIRCARTEPHRRPPSTVHLCEPFIKLRHRCSWQLPDLHRCSMLCNIKYFIRVLRKESPTGFG